MTRTSPRLVVAADLDRTLIYSARAAGHGVDGVDGVDVEADGVCVEVYDDAPLSYVARRAVPALEAMVAGGLLVPATTRTAAQYRRIALPGGPAPYAVCLNGGRVLVDDVDDPGFAPHLAAARAASASFDEMGAVVRAWSASVASQLGEGRVRDAEALFHYVVFDDTVEASELTEPLREAAEARDWLLSVQGRKAYVVPRGVTKEAGLAYLERAHGLQVLGAAGDSLLDAGMLAAAPAAWTPCGGELHRSGATGAASVTEGTGLDAGAEIVAALAGLLAAQA